MKKLMIGILLMFMLTVIYITAVVYVNANSGSVGTVYGAFEYKSGIPPLWYTPEQLGIVKIIEQQNENGSYWLQVAVEEEPFPLLEELPAFKYKDKFFQISPLWVTPGLPESLRLKPGQIPAGVGIGAGWALVGWFGFAKRRNRTKKIALVGLICLLIASICANILGASASSTSSEDVRVLPGLPSECFDNGEHRVVRR